MKVDETLSAEFGIQPISKTEVISKNGDLIKPSDNKIDDDYEVSRNNMRVLLQQGQEALTSALEVARQSEHPRAFEVVGNLIKQLADINQQLLDLHSQKQKLDEPSKSDKTKQVTNNAIFVGSTTELNKLIKNMTKGDA
jgi:hypothetical protein